MKAWISLEGFWLWVVIIFVVISQNQELFGIDWPASTSIGFGRIVAFPIVALMHLLLAALLLTLMLSSNVKIKWLLVVLGLTVCFIGLYSIWWPGFMLTTFPLVIGATHLVVNSTKSVISYNKSLKQTD